MGTDIHGVVQGKRNGKWETLGEFYSYRHYDLFAILADVRNGFGFAGIPTTDTKFTSLSSQRGLPDDFDVVDGEYHPVGPTFESFNTILGELRKSGGIDSSKFWMGDHSHTWVTLREVLSVDIDGTYITKFGVLSEDQYKAWDKKSPPSSYSAGVGGMGVVLLSQGDYENKSITPMQGKKIYVRVSWTENYASILGQHFIDYINKLVKLSEEFGGPDNIRIVMGFDS